MEPDRFRETQALFARALAVVPGGIYGHQTPAMLVPGAYPYFFARGEGARIWDVDLFSTNQLLPSLNVTTIAQPDFHFTLKGYIAEDAAFEYDPVGDAQGIAIETGTCTGNGHLDYPGPFTKGFLAISGKLTSYTAHIPLGKLAPFIVQVTCLGGVTYPGRFALQDLVTFVGDRKRPVMTPSATKLPEIVGR